MSSEHKKIPLLSFFTGGGFLDMGFERTQQFETVWTNEYDPIFAKFYAEGFTAWLKNLDKDFPARSISNTKKIQDLTGSQIKTEAFGATVPSIFGVIGGPPCQDFSLMGKKNGFDGDRGKLTKEFLGKVNEIQPSFFLMENVAGLIHVKKTKKVFIEHLSTLGESFFIDYFTLNALHYGAPQSRERVFVIGVSKDLLPFSETQFNFKDGWIKSPCKIYGDAFSWKTPSPHPFGQHIEKEGDVPLELCVESHLVPEEDMSTIPNANEYFKLHTSIEKLNNIKEGETNRPSFKRLHRYKYSPTVCYGNNEVHLHPYKQRRLSVREALRLQGVQDSYVLSSQGQLSKKFKMIGNGVPVPLAEAVARTLYSFFLKNQII